MRGLAVLTIAFVFATAAPFVGPVSAQASVSLSGQVCALPSWASPMEGEASPDADCSSGLGLPDAVVRLTRAGTLPPPVPGPLGPSEATATADANGRYSFSGLSDGDYAFTVTRAGFEDATGTLTVGPGASRDFALTGKVVEAKGKVLDPDGGGVAKATIGLCCGPQGYVSATSAADGRYTASVQAGFWSLDVSAPGFQPASQHLLIDGAADIDVRVERIPPQDARIAGRVLDQDGAPVAEARVSLYGYGGGCCYAYDSVAPQASSSRPYYGGENYTFTDADGRYAIGAYSGDNHLSVSKDGYAQASRSLVVEPGQTASADVELLKFPEKTATITGKVVDAATGKGLANLYVNLHSPEYGLSEWSCSAATPQPAKMAAESSDAMSYPVPADDGCGIRTSDDGTFEGLVTPGYGILSVSVDWYATCLQSGGFDGSSSSMQDCGPQYYSWSAARVLPADDTTSFDVRLRSRPAPDAEVSGYVLDAESGLAIPGAQVSFSNQDTYGWGSAVTDDDGSYRLRLRSGYHSVSVWAEGHLRWEGVLDVPSGDTPFDVTVQPGQEAGCCSYGPYYGGGVAYAEASDAKAGSSGAMSATATSAPMADDGFGAAAGDQQYEDLGGGLGPYDAQARRAQLEQPADGSPGLGLVAFLAAIGAVFALRRRLA